MTDRWRDVRARILDRPEVDPDPEWKLDHEAPSTVEKLGQFWRTRWAALGTSSTAVHKPTGEEQR